MQLVGAPTKTSVVNQIWPTGPSLVSLSLNTKYCIAKLVKLPPLRTLGQNTVVGMAVADIDLAVFVLAENECLDSLLWVLRQTF